MSVNNAFPNRQSRRLKGYDYTTPGAYFVTILTSECGDWCIPANTWPCDRLDAKNRCLARNGTRVGLFEDEAQLKNIPDPPDHKTANGLTRVGLVKGETQLRTVRTHPCPDLDGSPDGKRVYCGPLGVLLDDVMHLTQAGIIVREAWQDLPHHYANLLLDEFVIMPDHIHGLIIIKNVDESEKIHGLPEFVRTLKSFSARRINRILNRTGESFWHRDYDDVIIRDKKSLFAARNYIRYNPERFRQKDA
jgi:REP element-mobilizing transposase RayT